MHTKGELGGEHHGGVLTHFWAGAVFENDSLSIPMVWYGLVWFGLIWISSGRRQIGWPCLTSPGWLNNGGLCIELHIVRRDRNRIQAHAGRTSLSVRVQAPETKCLVPCRLHLYSHVIQCSSECFMTLGVAPPQHAMPTWRSKLRRFGRNTLGIVKMTIRGCGGELCCLESRPCSRNCHDL